MRWIRIVAPAFVVGNAMVQANTYHNLPAPLAIQSCLYEGSLLPIDAALRVETVPADGGARAGLARHDPHAVRQQEQGREGPAPPGRHRPNKCRKLGMIGAGMMGGGIALNAARAASQWC